MDLAGKTAAVVGLGRSGVAAARLLLARGARVIGVDEAPREKASAAALELETLGAELALGSSFADDVPALDRAELVVVSPGVPSFAELEAVEKSGREVLGELELASRFISAPIVLVGGTNGKSTTTALVGAMFEAAGQRTFIGGNFGTPPCEALAKGETYDVWVLEISSFQAERVPTLHARAHALLNITDDHLDRYASFDAYADAKGNPFARMTSADLAVLPNGDAIVDRQVARGGARRATFGTHAGDTEASVRFDHAALVHASSGFRFPVRELRIQGAHNLQNACAALAIAVDLGVPDEAIDTALRAFAGLGHRNVLVRELGGVRYYDDSKGTNVGAARAALRGREEARVVLIAGGRDKLGDYTPLVGALAEKGRALVVLGEAADRIAAAARGVLPVERVASMEEAVARARKLAHPGDAVLLSPACSSFDMFRSYAHRGDVFARSVNDLEAAS